MRLSSVGYLLLRFDRQEIIAQDPQMKMLENGVRMFDHESVYQLHEYLNIFFIQIVPADGNTLNRIVQQRQGLHLLHFHCNIKDHRTRMKIRSNLNGKTKGWAFSRIFFLYCSPDSRPMPQTFETALIRKCLMSGISFQNRKLALS